MITKMSDEGMYFLINEEGIKLKPYLDSRGVPTIGIGSTFYEDGTRVKITDPQISKDRAVTLFKNILQSFEYSVAQSLKVFVNQNQFDALISITYNIGVAAFKNSTLLKRVNSNPNDPSIKEAFLMWKNSGGKSVLLKRRQREVKLYFKTR